MNCSPSHFMSTSMNPPTFVIGWSNVDVCLCLFPVCGTTASSEDWIYSFIYLFINSLPPADAKKMFTECDTKRSGLQIMENHLLYL